MRKAIIRRALHSCSVLAGGTGAAGESPAEFVAAGVEHDDIRCTIGLAYVGDNAFVARTASALRRAPNDRTAIVWGIDASANTINPHCCVSADNMCPLPHRVLPSAPV